MSKTANLNLPLVQERQAHKHISVNESLSLLDVLTQLVVENKTLTSPPDSPLEGAAYIIAAEPTDGWQGKAGAIAFFQNSAWHTIPPKEGFSAWNKDDNKRYTFYNNDWHSA